MVHSNDCLNNGSSSGTLSIVMAFQAFLHLLLSSLISLNRYQKNYDLQLELRIAFYMVRKFTFSLPRPWLSFVFVFYLKLIFTGAFVPQLLFFYLPVSIIIGLNIVLFIALVMQLYQSRQRGSQMRHSHENMSETQNTFNCKRTDEWVNCGHFGFKSIQLNIFSVRLYLLLFLVAGVAWILEIISFLTPPDTIIYLIIDIWYCLQGILIFILLVLRRPVVQLIKERFIL